MYTLPNAVLTHYLIINSNLLSQELLTKNRPLILFPELNKKFPNKSRLLSRNLHQLAVNQQCWPEPCSVSHTAGGKCACGAKAPNDWRSLSFWLFASPVSIDIKKADPAQSMVPDIPGRTAAAGAAPRQGGRHMSSLRRHTARIRHQGARIRHRR